MAREKSVSDFKASEERQTFLLGSNAAGDFKFKAMLIYHSENPRTLRITLNLLFLCSVSGTRKP